jgi:hypothetical protein
MKYLCLIYDEEKRLGARSQSESDAFTGEYFAFTDGIRKSGHYLGGEALQPVQTATTVRVRNGKVSATDGHFADKEQLGGVEARGSYGRALALTRQEPERRFLERRLAELPAT